MEKIAIDEQPVEDLVIEFEASDIETHSHEELHENETWGDEQRMLVEANQDVVVVCPWMGNAEVTLSTAMNTYEYPPNLTAEDEPFLLSVVYGLLANRVIEEEEPEELTLEDEEELVVGEKKVMSEEDETTPPEEESNFKVLVNELSQVKEEPAVFKKQHQTSESLVDTKIFSQPLNEVETDTAHINSEDTQPGKSADLGDAARGIVDLQESKVEMFADALNTEEAVTSEVAEILDNDKAAELISSRVEVDDEVPECSEQLIPVEISTKPEALTLSAQFPKTLPEGVTLLISRSVDINEGQSTSITSHIQLDRIEPQDFYHKDIKKAVQAGAPARESINGDSGFDEQTDAQEGEETWVDMNTTTIELSAEIDAVIEQIIAEQDVQVGHEVIADATDHYVNEKIKAAIESQVMLFEEDDPDMAESTKELEDLLREVFVGEGINPSPELVEDLALQTVKQRRRVAKNRKFEDEEIADDMQKTGASTVAKKPSAARVTLNTTMLHTRLISKAALELCGFKGSFRLS